MSGELEGMIKALFGRLTSLEAKTAESFKDIYNNQTQLKAALDSSEFNLRAHQKVLNAVAAELHNLHFRSDEDEDRDPNNADMFEHLIVQLKDEEMAKIDWSAYHEHVTADLEELNRLDAIKLKEENTQMATVIKKDLEWFKESKMKAIASLEPEQHEAAVKTLNMFAEKAASEADNVLADKEFDQERLKKVFGLFAAEKVRVREESVPAPEVPRAGPEPEGATIFGGA